MRLTKRIISSLILYSIVFSACFNLFALKSEAITISEVMPKEGIFEIAEYKKSDYYIPATSIYDVPNYLSEKTTINTMADGVKLGSTYGLGGLPSTYKTEGLKVKHQGPTGECWAFSTTTLLEAYDKKKGRINYEYSPRHIDYTCSKSFTDVSSVTTPLLNRETSSNVGNYFLAAAYLASAKGPVLESNYPFNTDTSGKVAYSSLNKPKEELVKNYKMFPAIYKSYSGNNITYYKAKGTEASFKRTAAEVQSIRDEFKSHLMEYGAISSMVYQRNTAESDIYCGPGYESTSPNHAVTIVGWDDNYIKEGWPKAGAYICQNSYGTENFYDGFVYVSYEDSFIEQNAFGIKDAETYDVDKVYEYDHWGSTGIIDSTTLTNSTYTQYNKGEITAVNNFTRNTSDDEVLDKVGFCSWSNQKVEIWVSETFTENGEAYNFTKVKNLTQTLEPGMYILNLDNPYTLTKGKYAVAVRYVEDNQEGVATAAIETFTTGVESWWYNIEGNIGESYFLDVFNSTSTGKLLWSVTVPGTTGKYVNSSVKAYTKVSGQIEPPPLTDDPEDLLVSNTYKINGEYRRITMVEPKTDYHDFLREISINSKYPEYAEKEIIIVDQDKKRVTDGYIKTGYMVLVSNSEYKVAVRGDVSGDGQRNIIDLVRLRKHLVGYADSTFTGITFYAADVNGTETINILDLTVMRKLLVE